MNKINIGMLSGCAVLFLASVGTAADGKVFNGLNCVELNDTTPEVAYQSNGAARNTSSSNQWLFCPVVRDIMSSSMDIKDWDVTVDRNGNTGDAWDVEIWSLTPDGGSGFKKVITVPTTDGAQTLDGAGVTSAHTRGQIYVRSVVPDGAEIRSYYVEEE